MECESANIKSICTRSRYFFVIDRRLIFCCLIFVSNHIPNTYPFQPPKKIVNLNNVNEKIKAEKLKVESKKENQENKQIVEKTVPEEKKIVEEESGSETDEPGATSDGNLHSFIKNANLLV